MTDQSSLNSPNSHRGAARILWLSPSDTVLLFSLSGESREQPQTGDGLRRQISPALVFSISSAFPYFSRDLNGCGSFFGGSMSKKGFVFPEIPSLISKDSDKPNWSLCIGAGVSYPLFPDWFELAAKLLNKSFKTDLFSKESLKATEFSPDTLIQIAKNESQLDSVAFENLMSETLYQNFREKVDPDDWASISAFLENNQPLLFKNEQKVFKKYQETLLKQTTSYVLAEAIFHSIDKNIAPKSILSFNAEPLLFSILNSFSLDKKTDKTHTVPKRLFNKVLNSTSNQNDKRIQFYFCHGLLPLSEKSDIHTFSTQKLVFSELEYLNLTNNAFSWQANTFINHCLTQHIFFVGTSLTDPNMRRWLGLTHQNRLNEMQSQEKNVTESTQHYWLNLIPENEEQIKMTEASVAHLGVRVIWLQKWSQAGTAIEKALGIYEKTKALKKPSQKTLKRTPTSKKGYPKTTSKTRANNKNIKESK